MRTRRLLTVAVSACVVSVLLFLVDLLRDADLHECDPFGQDGA